MSRLIDADRLLRPDMIRMCYHLPNGDIAMPIGDIKHAPTVDAVPVTRCKDCKWYDTEYHCKLNGYGCGRSPDWFCADGKKEEEECTSTDTER